MIATAPIPVERAGDFFVPQFEVIIGNRRQSGAVVRDIIQATYKDNVDEIDSFELTVNNWDAEQRKFKYSDRDLFNPKQDVELRMGYAGAGGSLQTMLRGRIESLRPAFPAGGQPTLAVGGTNILQQFKTEQRSDSYEKQTVQQIARRICSRLRVDFVPPKAPVVETPVAHRLQDNQYDIVFLMGLARDYGYELIVEEAGGTTALAFGPPSPSARPTYRLAYGRSLIEFQPTLSMANQVSEVEVRGWDSVKGEAIAVKVGQAQLGAQGGIQARLKKGTSNPVADRKEVIATQPVRDRQAATDLAKATLRRINNEMITATGSVVGLPDLRAGAQLHIGGVGLRFNGRYFVKATTHTVGNSGYTTQFECRLEELSHRSDGEALAQ